MVWFAENALLAHTRPAPWASGALQHTASSPDAALTRISAASLTACLNVGDVVFIRIPIKPFLQVASATRSWTNHVGIVMDIDGAEPMIAESAFPLTRVTPFSRFLRRSDHGRVAISRPAIPIGPLEQARIRRAVRQRARLLYDTGFNLHSRRQFCSRYVREVLLDATGLCVGKEQSFAELYAEQPAAALRFWKLWYLGRIPWSRVTVTPASLLRCGKLELLFDGHVG